ncbi:MULTISPECIES: alpha/beta hydrolase [Oxalobacteraceae]|jgi:3-oxoadipate enol-lactonase|uniref:alpha/beta fold hydrolase n=1 Tax=Oxalobacteraceae TaxID=75682 RepID=UPI0010A38C27|nr:MULTISPECIES: alpha/beta hydrolase [Oxalobacteraceae]
MPKIRVNDTELYYEDDGPRDAPAIVFSHSLFFNSHMFYKQAEYFSREYRVIRYDHRGQGRSAPAPLEEQDTDTLADDATALIEALDLGKCHVVGNSLGGFIALRLAARRPDLTASCAVLGSSGEAEYKVAEFQPIVDNLQRVGGAPLVDTLLYVMFGDASLTDPGFADELDYWRKYMSQLGTSIGNSAYQVVHRRGILDELRGSKVPVLAIAGEEDHAYTVPLAQNIANAVLDGRMETVAKAGHSVALESPALVNALLESHFARAGALQ